MVKRTAADAAGAENRLDRNRFIARLSEQLGAARLGLKIANAGGYNEIRAQYAGFFLASALVCAASLAGTVPRQAAFIVLVVVFGGLFAGRAVSVVVDGGFVGYGGTVVGHAIDAIGLAAGEVATSARVKKRGRVDNFNYRATSVIGQLPAGAIRVTLPLNAS
jgi:hypothetical protein